MERETHTHTEGGGRETADKITDREGRRRAKRWREKQRDKQREIAIERK